MVFKPVFAGHGIYAEPAADVPTDCLIFWTLSVKNLAKPLQAMVEWSSVATDTGGFVSLSTVANKARAL